MGSDSNSTSSPPSLRSAYLLFSLQFFVDRVTLNPAPKPLASATACSAPLLVGFQLLQYEIVMFDAAVEDTMMLLRHGKSCLFEADPDELVHELQRDVEAPLTLLLMAREHGRARLRAFAAVPLSLHMTLLDDDALSCSRLPRICEWASQSGLWDLRDHHNEVVGSVTGAVTLSCLGKALAPHLTQALGVQVNKSEPSSPQVEVETKEEVKDEDKKQEDIRASSASSGANVVEKKDNKVEEGEVEVVKKLDSSVQCDEDMFVKAADEPLSRRDGSNRGGWSRFEESKMMAMKDTKHSDADGPMVYYKSSTTNSRHTARQRTGRDSKSARNVPATVTKGDLLFPRELPPPLFFQKSRRAKP